MKTEERKYSINEQTIKKAMEKTRGYITARQANYLGVSGGYLKQMANKGVIEKVGWGIYMDSLEYPDGFYILNMQCPKIIFSHLTALSFYEMSKIDPYDVWDITIPYGYHDDRLRGHNLHCVKKDIFELGAVINSCSIASVICCTTNSLEPTCELIAFIIASCKLSSFIVGELWQYFVP